ncbi:hypothetical protein D3P09_19615 [Paenibacillus pinisoli]|uniref:Uncharacterized protein n=1 Tax=Paenibacillus pinisoli TaxID=1276110 RepID=A0A3A6PDV0_9BACL|nr:hypothetical protein [Paenibacillus pinisoli]RJX38270.1 hypothetical protein D3P09_19615 [Paenibacillus pinisoli]
MEQQQNGKRSWALPITLVLLVFSLMGNILLYTKHIEHTRSNTELTGETIFQGFKDGQEQVARWSASMGEIGQYASSEPALARLTAAHLADSIQGDRDGLTVLMEQAAAIDASVYGEASEAYRAYEEKLTGELRVIGAGSGPITEAEQGAIVEVQSSFVNLAEILSAFHYAMEGDRNSMFRLSGGHDWIEIAAELQKAIKSYTGA